LKKTLRRAAFSAVQPPEPVRPQVQLGNEGQDGTFAGTVAISTAGRLRINSLENPISSGGGP
jgi:hypothetical protein